MDQQIAKRITELEAQAEALQKQIANRPVLRGATAAGQPHPLQEQFDKLQAQITDLRDIGAQIEQRQGEQYDLHQALNRARRRADAATITNAQKRLFANQHQLTQLTQQANALLIEEADEKPAPGRVMRGARTTGLVAEILSQMAQVPIAYCHLLDAERHPLVRCRVRNASDNDRRIRVITFIEGYTAQDIKSVELPAKQTVETSHLPTFFPGNTNKIRELTRATLNVLVEDLDTKKVEIHQTQPIWLLARNSAPLAVQNPQTNDWTDLSRYLGAFVTPHQEDVEAFLSDVVAEEYGQALVGYQAGGVTPQVAAIYTALQKRNLRYVDSTIDFVAEPGASTQRVRLPRETLTRGQANCIDGTLLMASLLEAIGINAALVLVPGHAFLGWSTVVPAGAPGRENQADEPWDYLETTYLGKNYDFDQARQTGQARANAAIAQQREADADPKRQGEWWLAALVAARVARQVRHYAHGIALGREGRAWRTSICASATTTVTRCAWPSSIRRPAKLRPCR